MPATARRVPGVRVVGTACKPRRSSAATASDQGRRHPLRSKQACRHRTSVGSRDRPEPLGRPASGTFDQYPGHDPPRRSAAICASDRDAFRHVDSRHRGALHRLSRAASCRCPQPAAWPPDVKDGGKLVRTKVPRLAAASREGRSRAAQNQMGIAAIRSTDGACPRSGQVCPCRSDRIAAAVQHFIRSLSRPRRSTVHRRSPSARPRAKSTDRSWSR